MPHTHTHIDRAVNDYICIHAGTEPRVQPSFYAKRPGEAAAIRAHSKCSQSLQYVRQYSRDLSARGYACEEHEKGHASRSISCSGTCFFRFRDEYLSITHVPTTVRITPRTRSDQDRMQDTGQRTTSISASVYLGGPEQNSRHLLLYGSRPHRLSNRTSEP